MAILGVALLLGLVGSCARSPQPSGAAEAGDGSGDVALGDGAVEPESLDGELVVFGAASLRNVFETLGERLAAEHPDLRVTYSFASSTTLADQVLAGAPADILATADSAAMDRASDAILDPLPFARNALVIVTEPGNPQDVVGISDFARSDLTVAVCAVQVPCGAAAEVVFEVAEVEPRIATYGENVTATLNLVVNGEVDAALVYQTDANSVPDDVDTIDFSESSAAVIQDMIAVTSDAGNPEAAAAFVELVMSEAGQQVLHEAGFLAP